MASNTELEASSTKLDNKQYGFMLYIEQYFWKYSSVPSYETLKNTVRLDIEEEFYWSCFRNIRFTDGLRARGVPEHLIASAIRGADEAQNPFTRYLLTEEQMTCANQMLDILDRRSKIKKLVELGISTNTYNSWLKDPAYQAYCRERAEALLIENQHVAHMSLIDRVSQGDLGAIKYYNSMTGRFRDKAAQAASVEVNVNNNNYGNDTLIAVVEIIQKHVKDPAMLDAIANDILALKQGQQSQQGQQQIVPGLAITNRQANPYAI